MENKWYTGAGDDGYTSLIGGQRVLKHSPRPEAYGQVDELQAVLGMCRAASLSPEGKEIVAAVERDLYQLMAELAAPAESGIVLQLVEVKHIEWLEARTDELSDLIPAFESFLLPGDSPAGALVNLARTVARRAERAVVSLAQQEKLPSDLPIRYLNRLSSLLFILARYEDLQAGVNEPSTVASA